MTADWSMIVLDSDAIAAGALEKIREEIGRFISVVKNPIRFCRIRICDRHWPETGPGMIGRSAWPNIDEPVANC